MKFKNLILIAGLILVISGITYYFLGGMDDVKYSIQPASSYSLVGKEYSGGNNSILLESIFDQTKELLDSRFPEGILVIVNDESQYDDEYNKVWYFIGIIPNAPASQLPEGYSLRKFDSKKVIRANIEAHNLVMPKPEVVRKRAENLAEIEGLKLSRYSIEKYVSEGVIEIDFLVIE
jgi:hypothetical protein